VLVNAITHAQGPYVCDNAVVDGWAARTNNPPCGAMRGFGVVQACFAHEAQMDKLAAATGVDPVEIRRRNAMRTGDRLITGQVVESVAPVRRCIDETAALPLPPPAPDDDPMRRPGGAGLTADAGHVRRGVGFAVAIKNLMYSEGFDDFSTARCRLADGVAVLKFATAEVGQGFVTIAQQIARTVLGVDEVVLEPMDTSVGSAGSTSASRQTWMSGGAPSTPPAGPCGSGCSSTSARQHGIDPAAARDRGHATWSTRWGPCACRCRGQRRAAVSRRRSSSATGPPPSSTRTARATRTRRSPSWPIGRWSTSIPTSAW
jgi:hypothetical protein